MDLLPGIAEEIVNQIKDVNQVAEQLNRYDNEVAAFGLGENFVSMNSIG